MVWTRTVDNGFGWACLLVPGLLNTGENTPDDKLRLLCRPGDIYLHPPVREFHSGKTREDCLKPVELDLDFHLIWSMRTKTVWMPRGGGFITQIVLLRGLNFAWKHGNEIMMLSVLSHWQKWWWHLSKLPRVQPCSRCRGCHEDNLIRGQCIMWLGDGMKASSLTEPLMVGDWWILPDCIR